MISQLSTVMMSDRSVVAACPLGVSLRGTALASALLPVLPIRERMERPTEAPAAAATAQAKAAYAFAAAANGAGTGSAEGGSPANGHENGQQKKHGTKWAFRGLEPWSDPA
jgi:hypothetical protein